MQILNWQLLGKLQLILSNLQATVKKKILFLEIILLNFPNEFTTFNFNTEILVSISCTFSAKKKFELFFYDLPVAFVYVLESTFLDLF